MRSRVRKSSFVPAGLGRPWMILRARPWLEFWAANCVRNEEILRGIQERFRKFGRAMPETNVRQAMVPEGAEPLDNPRGTAPGLWIETNGPLHGVAAWAAE